MGYAKCKPMVFDLKGEPQKVLEAVKKAAKGIMTIKGDATKGTMQHNKHKVKGTYAVKGKKITIVMAEDEWFDQCPGINKKVTDWFKGK